MICNDLVMTWLIFNLDETIVRSVLFLPIARDIWCDLEDRFGFASMAQVYELEQKIAKASQGSRNISAFFTAMKTLWDCISYANPLPACTCHNCACCNNLTQKNDNFAAVRANILMMQPLPHVSQAYRLFAHDERHKEISQEQNSSDSLAFLADKRWFNVSSQDNFK